ncbi:MAG: endonuclease/exonuclease/phosphatase family protein [Phycisphaerales bacterium]|nr:endonuclease/exonuclease/phosphatase family protein [Phycisphaerales bacterium]MCI0630312.1 endonuclease/exonuclease/phosphatase family protein [Phycisphaerales bacterium]
MLSSIPFVAAALLLQSPAAPASTPAGIVLDAEFDDWSQIAPVLTDPADAPSAFIDFGEVRITHDDRFVHLLIDVGRTVNAQGLDGTAMILLDADGNPATGRDEHDLLGVDFIIDLSPPQDKRPGTPGHGIGLRSTNYTPAKPESAKVAALNPYDIGFAFAPTHAGRRFEFRFDRGAKVRNSAELFRADHFTAKLVFIDLQGNLADSTDSFAHQLGTQTVAATEDTPRATDPLARPASTSLRAMSWNAHLGAIFTNSEPFTRVFAALKPDVVLLQELTDDNSAQQVRAFLESALPPVDRGAWNVAFGSGGGNLRCAVASTFPIQTCESLQLVAMPDRPDRSVRAIGAVIETAGKRLLVVSIHLKCCGRAGGDEDAQREVEVQAIHQAIAAATAASTIDGIIIAGDYNLVGARDPLEMLASTLDRDRSALTPVQTLQLDGLSNATWSDPKQPFVPGRLDYLLYSDSSLRPVNSFAFDSQDLTPQWLTHHKVKGTDTTLASDHLPLVVDLAWVSTMK